MSGKLLVTIFLFISLIFMLTCGEDLPVFNPPADHTLSYSGKLHKPGLLSPLTNCTSCHGTDLSGALGPSCYTCHSQKW